MACGAAVLGLGPGCRAQQAKACRRAPSARPGLVRDRLPVRLHPLRMCVRDCPYDILHAGQSRQQVATGTPFFVARSQALRDVRDIPCVKRPVRPARSTAADRHHPGQDGPGGAGRPRNLPQLPGPALRRVLPRVPGDRQGHHARSCSTTSARAAHHVPADGALPSTARAAASAKPRACWKSPPSKVYPIAGQGRVGRTTASAGKKSEKAGQSLVEDKGLIDLPTACPRGMSLPGHLTGRRTGARPAPLGSEGLPDGAPR